MIREKIDASQERTLVMLGVTSTDFLKEIHPLCKPELFRSSYARTVWGWIDYYYQTYNCAPGKDIQDIYTKRKLELDEDEEAIATFLHSLSEEYDKELYNLQYIIGQSKEWLNYRSVEVLRDALSDHLSRKDVSGAQEAIAMYSRVEGTPSDCVDVINEHEAGADAFLRDEEELFRFPGALGVVLGAFKRTDFVTFLAPMKQGKSWALWEVAKQATYCGNNVLFISLEMPKRQMLRRIWTSFMHQPKTPQVVKIPRFVEADDSTEQEPKYVVDVEERQMEALDPEPGFFMAWKKRFRKYFRRGNLKLACMASLTVRELANYLDNLEFYDKFVPDVVVIDYAKLMHSDVKGEPRFKIDDIHKNLRAMALKRNICIVSAWQANRIGLHEDLQMEHVSEDIGVVAHVTKMIGINATREEKAMGLYRFSQIAEREDAQVFEQAYVTSCLALGSIFLDSRFRNEVSLPKGDHK